MLSILNEANYVTSRTGDSVDFLPHQNTRDERGCFSITRPSTTSSSHIQVSTPGNPTLSESSN